MLNLLYHLNNRMSQTKKSRTILVGSIFFLVALMIGGIIFFYNYKGNFSITGFGIFDGKDDKNLDEKLEGIDNSNESLDSFNDSELFADDSSQDNKNIIVINTRNITRGRGGGGDSIITEFPNESNDAIEEVINKNESFDEGEYNNTFYNSTNGSVQVNSSDVVGFYLSPIFDAGNVAEWINISWYGNVNLTVRSCDDSNCENDFWNETYTGFFANLNLEENRYFQYRVDFYESNETSILYNVTFNYRIVDLISPLVILISPGDSTGFGKGEVKFSFNVSDENLIDRCDLIINDEVYDVFYNPARDVTQEFTLSKMKFGNYYWSLNCVDSFGNSRISETRKVSVVHFSGYSGKTTDFSKVKMNKIKDFTLDKPGFGKIKFLEDIDLSSGADIDSYVEIGYNIISVDSENIPELNKSANLTFYGLSYENPFILKNGEPCLDCIVLGYDENGLVFSVGSFSNYSVSENSRLDIWDDTDNTRSYGGNISFYANYSKVADGLTVPGSSCNIDVGEGFVSMDYNASSNLYEYYKVLGTGIHSFEISCSAAGYTTFDLTDSASIDSFESDPNGAQVEFVKSSRGNVAEPDNSSSNAGNITELTIYGDSITQSWQGYYGDVTGVIELTDSSDNVFYNWSALSPKGEVYSTRFFDINFASIGCADEATISFEESSMGQNSSDVDSLSSTFNETNHPQFYVGHTQIISNSCNSTNIYDSSGAQSSLFFEVVLADDALHTVYVSILEQDAQGFDSETHDFEMIVPEDGHGTDTAVTVYYFYLEVQ